MVIFLYYHTWNLKRRVLPFGIFFLIVLTDSKVEDAERSDTNR